MYTDGKRCNTVAVALKLERTGAGRGPGTGRTRGGENKTERTIERLAITESEAGVENNQAEQRGRDDQMI